MSGFTLYCVKDVSDPPNELLKRDLCSYYQYIPVPLPPHLVLFCLGELPEGDGRSPVVIEVAIQYRDERLLLGELNKQCRALCWLQSNDKPPACMVSDQENGMAKLVMEVKGMCADSSASDEDVKVILDREKKEEMSAEDEGITPSVKGTKKKKEPTKPAKTKRRTSKDESDNTPTGPVPKKHRRNTRVRGLKLETKNKENVKTEEKENTSVCLDSSQNSILSSETESPSKPTMKTPNKCIMSTSATTPSICKDVTSRASPNPSSRWGHSLCMIHDKMAVLVGGQGERQQLSKDSVWNLDPVTRKWKCPDLKSENQKPEYRMGHTSNYDPMVNCIYVFGGSKNLKWFHDVHMLDIDEWKWQLLKVSGKAPTRAYHSSTLYRNELWVFGGVYPRPDPQPDGCSNEVHIFSPVMESWYTPIVKGDKPLPRSGHSATLINDQLVMFGGWDAPYVYNDLHILDMSIVEWSKPECNGAPPLPRSWHASCALSGKRILIHGGYDGNLAMDDTHILSLDTFSWMKIKLDPKPIPRAGHQCVCLPYSDDQQKHDEVFIFGGGDNDGAFYRDLISINISFNPELDHSVQDNAPVLVPMDSNTVAVC